MPVTLPPVFGDLLNDLGYTWPEIDEDQLYALAQRWHRFALALTDPVEEASGAAAEAWKSSAGEAIAAFRDRWHEPAAPALVLTDARTASDVLAASLTICALVVMALKLSVLINITTLLVEIAEAVAAAPLSAGTSLAEIPAFKEVTTRTLNLLTTKALTTIFG